jgi:hypothetical protein
MCSLISGCGIGCLFSARSNSLDISAIDHPVPEFRQVIKDAITPFGFVGVNPADPSEVRFYVGHGGIRFPPPRNTVDIEIDTTTNSVKLVDFGNRQSKFDEDVMDAIHQHVETAYGQSIRFAPEEPPPICFGP